MFSADTQEKQKTNVLVVSLINSGMVETLMWEFQSLTSHKKFETFYDLNLMENCENLVYFKSSHNSVVITTSDD